jgi:hypothetical protein
MLGLLTREHHLSTKLYVFAFLTVTKMITMSQIKSIQRIEGFHCTPPNPTPIFLPFTGSAEQGGISKSDAVKIVVPIVVIALVLMVAIVIVVGVIYYRKYRLVDLRMFDNVIKLQDVFKPLHIKSHANITTHTCTHTHTRYILFIN